MDGRPGSASARGADPWTGASPDRYVGLSAEEARRRFGEGKTAAVTVRFSETIKGCVDRAQPYGDDEFYKLVYHAEDGRILGVHIYGSNASEMIHFAAALVNRANRVFEVIKMVPPAVTLQEALKKACMRAAIGIAAAGRMRAAAGG